MDIQKDEEIYKTYETSFGILKKNWKNFSC